MTKKICTKMFGIMLILTMIFSLTACAKKADSKATNGSAVKAETKVDKIKKAGKLVIGTSADYPPYEFHKQVNGQDQIVGFDIEIAKEIAKDLGVKLEIKDITFDGLLEALKADKIDMVIAGMNPTAERAKQVDFSKVYYTAVQSVMIRAEDKDKYKGLADLSGKKVGVQMGTVQEGLAKDQIPGAQLQSLGAITDLVPALKFKKIDAIVLEGPVAKSYVAANSDLMVTDMQFKQDTETKGSAVAVQKNSPEFVAAINSTLDRLINDKSIDKFVTAANEMNDGSK